MAGRQEPYGNSALKTAASCLKGLHLHQAADQVFEPTGRAIDGLEKALAGLGLLDQALALDLRRPQDYFGRVWSTAFRATDLAAAAEDALDADWPEEEE
ncbi:hypothetical protein [Streptomyces shenzhenensis]|uniref:hypothetical protein n=1 Tax=Streptomyces shenzhenensis TaxID=943815 RepID=UPI001F3EECAE|nr:hypothetical protein [Streptomyces shenzhenensis]